MSFGHMVGRRVLIIWGVVAGFGEVFVRMMLKLANVSCGPTTSRMCNYTF